MLETVSSVASSFKPNSNAQVKFKSDDDIIIQLEQLILQTTLGGDGSTNSSVGDPGFCRPARKNSWLQSQPRQTVNINESYDELLHLDYRLHDLVTRAAESLDGLASQTGDSEGKAIKDLESGIEQVGMGLKHIRALSCHTNDETALQLEMLERYEGILSGMKQAKKTIRNRKSPQTKAYVFNNRHYFESRLEKKDPATLLAAFIIIVLNVFGGLVREWASTALKLQLELLTLAFGGGRGDISANNQDLLNSFPRDIRTARKIFDLEATTKAYAACPGCSALYPVEGKQLPTHCNQRRYPNAKPCGARLTKSVVQNSNGERKMIRAPIQPFLIQDFDAFKASLLSRPGMEAILDRGTLFNDTNDMWDIKDGVGVKEMLGPDGEPFLDGLKRKELRLLWSLSVDWFNPRGNKAAGKAVSTGSVVMACLNLPPSLRYKAENLFLAAVMPKEPSVEEVGNYMEPLVEMLDKSWKNGTKFVQTESSKYGRIERSMLAVVVADLPASRKINGVAAHNAKEFLCLFCGLGRADINNLNRATWPRRSRDVLKKAAEDWRDAETAGKRKHLFKQTGVRWTPFWKLDYYNPIRMGTIDIMHNLFLGLVQFHIREVLGVEDPQAEEDHPVTIKELENARRGVAALNLKVLNRSRVSVLKVLCTENGIDISAARKPKKKHLIQLLTEQVRSQNTPASSDNPAVLRALRDPKNVVLIGEGYFEKSEDELKGPHVFIDKVTKHELEKLQRDIKVTNRPEYCQGPPLNLGSPGHGKLKADQWRTCIEFDIPVSVAQLWSKETCPLEQIQEVMVRRDKLFQSIMHLAVAVRWATSYRTSEHHSEKFEENMVAYLRCLLDLYPNIQFRPNHHAALHIGLFLTQFGPAHGWWMFPFERVIGILQRINTNSKLGELETTMLKTFCAGANLRALLQSKSCPTALKAVVPILERQWNQNRRTGTIGEINNLGNHEIRKVENGRRILLPREQYETVFQTAFKSTSKALPETSKGTFLNAQSHKRISIAGTVFAVNSQLPRNAEVFFQPSEGGSLIPGVIAGIFSIDDDGEDVFVLCIQPRKPVGGIDNPFSRFPDFGAEFWSTELDSVVQIPATQPLYHSQSRLWAKGIMVLKPVSFIRIVDFHQNLLNAVR